MKKITEMIKAMDEHKELKDLKQRLMDGNPIFKVTDTILIGDLKNEMLRVLKGKHDEIVIVYDYEGEPCCWSWKDEKERAATIMWADELDELLLRMIVWPAYFWQGKRWEENMTQTN